MAKILVVDDAAFMRLRAAKLLVEAGHEVIEAANGRLAVETYLRERPDCVLMDITMPEMDGLEALAAIRLQDPQARVAMLTALGQQSIVMDAIKRGARDFVVKPFAPGRVLAAVNRLLVA
jgi:two-component system, chemotaxis family, chemotaxis protein CheY